MLESYEGYKLPVSAIHIENGEKGVMVKTSGGAKFKKCRIVYSDTKGETVIVKPVIESNSSVLADNDEIMVGEK